MLGWQSLSTALLTMERPATSARGDVTRLLQAMGRGEPQALEKLLPIVYTDLHLLAKRQLRRNQRGNTLNTTDLVHEVYLKLVDQSQVEVADRGHFFALSARAMRQIIIDYARRRASAKRGGGQVFTSFDEHNIAIDEQADWLLDLDRALAGLAELDPELARVVECRFFAGLTTEETAAALGVSTSTVERNWRRARGWLRQEMEG